MQTVFKIIVGASVRYIRAANKASAQVRAFKVWGERNAQALAIGHASPEGLGAYGYTQASKAIEQASNAQALRAMQKGGQDVARSFYNPSNAQKVKTNNKAQAMLKALGLI